MVTRAIKSAQTQVEQQNFEIRKNVLKYDEVMNQQRAVIYDERRRILGREPGEPGAGHAVRRHHRLRRRRHRRGLRGGLGPGKLWEALRTLYPVGIDHHDLMHGADVGEPG